MNEQALFNGWFTEDDPLYFGWWSAEHSNDWMPGLIEVNSDGVVDYVSENHPLPVDIVNAEINVDLERESLYIDTRKNSWVDICSGGNDSIIIPASMPSNSINVEDYNAVCFKVIFDVSESCVLYPLVDSNGSPAFLDRIDVSGIYLNNDSKYESEIYTIDLYGFKQLSILKSGLSTGNVQIIGVFY